MFFEHLTFLAGKDGIFYVMIPRQGGATMMHLRKKPGAGNLLSVRKKMYEMERILETEGIEARAYTWEQLGYEVGLECSGRTIKKAMGTIDYHKCIACRRGWVNEKTRKDRLEYATIMLQRYPNPQDWYRVRFSYEVHFGYGPQDKLHIIRKASMRYCHSCIQKNFEPAEKDRKRYHY